MNMNMARLTGTYLKTSANVVTNKHEYTYNTGHQRTQQTFMDASTYGYTYDRIGQLTNADSSVAAQDRKYVYDAAWNLNFRTNNTTAHVFKVDGKNQVTNDWESYTATYDGNGNLTNRTSGIGGYDFTYDDENQLTAAQRPASWRIEFVYDGQGRLRKRLDYTWSGSWTLSATTTFVYDGKRVIQERNGSNTPTVSYTRGTDLSGSLEGAGGIGGLLGRSHGYSAGNWSTHNVYFADGNGNITYMLNVSQTKVAEYRYDPFGETISSSGSLASANLYRFSSKMYVVDGVLGNPGLYYYGYRFYYPSWQRWLNRDPLGELGFELMRLHSAEDQDEFAELLPEGPNLYAVVGNNPVNAIDADGRARGWEPPEPPSLPLPGGRSVKPTFTYVFYRNTAGCTQVQWWACLISGPPDPPDTVVIHPKDPARFSKCMALAREIWNNAGVQPWSPPNTAQLDRACKYAGKCYQKYW